MPPRTDGRKENDENSPNRVAIEDEEQKSDHANSNRQNLDHLLYSGAFAYTSPPERVLLSDSTNNYYGHLDQNTAGVSSFTTKFTVLKFNSDNKNVKNAANKSASKAPGSFSKVSNKSKKVNIFKNCADISKQNLVG